MSYYFKPLDISQLEEVHTLEAALYPADEAASKDTLAWRLTHAPDYAWGAYTPSHQLCAYVIGTKVLHFTAAAMGREHSVTAPMLAVHSVLTAPDFQGQGIAVWLLRRVLVHAALTDPALATAVLLTKPNNAALYARAGFTLMGPSPICHGAEVWLDMRLHVPRPPRSPHHLPCAVVHAAGGPAGSGNPAAVVLLSDSAQRALGMQADFFAGAFQPAHPVYAALCSIARDFALSETAFVPDRPGPDGRWALRWFTPTTEVALCGHATLAAGSALATWGCIPPCQLSVAFCTCRSGTLTLQREASQAGQPAPRRAEPVGDAAVDARAAAAYCSLDSPVGPVQHSWRMALPAGRASWLQEQEAHRVVHALAAALGGQAWDAAACRVANTEQGDVLVQLPMEALLQVPAPAAMDLPSIAKLATRGVILTAAVPGQERTFASRFLGPAVGVPEDPFTGSAHAALAVVWSSEWAVAEGQPCVARQLHSTRGTASTTVSLQGGVVTVCAQCRTTRTAWLQLDDSE